MSPLLLNWQSQNDSFIKALPAITPENVQLYSDVLRLELDTMSTLTGTNNIAQPIGGDFNFQDAPTLVRHSHVEPLPLHCIDHGTECYGGHSPHHNFMCTAFIGPLPLWCAYGHWHKCPNALQQC